MEAKKDKITNRKLFEAKANKRIVKLNENLEIQIKGRERAEASLKILSKHLLTVQEEERKRIARDLHDGVNQILSVVKLKLHSIERSVSDREQVFTNLNTSMELLEKAINEIRTISQNLRPLILDDLGLKASLRSVIKELSKRRKIKIELKIDRFTNNLPSEIELQLYRIIQEALNNIDKHSKAQNVKVIINVKNDRLNIFIKDDGKGFIIEKNLPKNLKKGKYGLIGMKERTESLGGTFNIKSIIGQSTEINISLPQK